MRVFPPSLPPSLNKRNITVDLDSYNRILTDTYRLAVTYRLTSYDAYLELALRKKTALGYAR
jgi:hypothetical protein